MLLKHKSIYEYEDSLNWNLLMSMLFMFSKCLAQIILILGFLNYGCMMLCF